MSARSHLYEIELSSAPAVGEEDGGYVLRPYDPMPQYPEVSSPEDLRDVAQVEADLRAIDWSFTADDTSFLTHDLHPYPAKFIPQIPGHCIARLSLPGDLVLDPFGGSGTTALEAVRLGRRALSIDANPVATLIARVKTCNLGRSAASDLHAIRSALTTCLPDLPSAQRLCDEHAAFIPDIPNVDKWFPESSRGELALIRSRILQLESATARDIAHLALSRIVLAVSFQDSETRYASHPREIPQGETVRRFLGAMESILRCVRGTQSALRYGVSEFRTLDTRSMSPGHCRPDSVDLVVTSPPYGNANDYHLYHRFRLLWLGSDPRDLAKVEIGSHLRHQKESSGFGSYLDDMRASLTGMFAALRAGRYAVLVVGDAVYKSVQYSGAESMGRVAEELGFETVCIVERPIHRTRRSFVSAGRRATTEKLLVLRKAPRRVTVWFQPPPYKLWPYEVVLRGQETHAILGVDGVGNWRQPQSLEVDPYTLAGARRLAFTHGIGLSFLDTDATWQAVLENGGATQPSARKDPKYVTHGLHPYKGKFYPQLAKGLINLCSPAAGARILDPFCGSGTTLLEGYLNGCQTYGCDMNPLAAKIAKAKVGILDVDPDIVREALAILVRRIEDAPATLPHETEQFALPCQREIGSWFPAPVIVKLNWLLRSIRSISQGVTRDFLEVVVSSIVRDVSQQEPSDLRIRRRKEPIEDADVFGLYLDALDAQYERIERFWSVRGHAPNKFLPCRVIEGDSRSPATLTGLGVAEGTIDLILTSPPYATALPYIDTDRLSLLAILGLDSSARRPLEHGLIGSREIVTHERKTLEDSLESDRERIPRAVRDYLLDLHRRVAQADVGFRRQNMPALLLRFFRDMDAVLANCRRALRVGGYAMVVIGDNRIGLGDADERIPTTDLVQEIGVSNGFTLLDRIDISVTTENLLHIRNAITENVVLRMRRAS